MVLLWILFVTVIDGFVALAGGLSLVMKDKTLRKILLVLVAFSAGALLGGAMLHLIAESLESMNTTANFLYVISGFCVFFLMEKFLFWHHCHEGKCDVHPVTSLILVGDGLHNFIDGLIIAASFLVSPAFGIVTSIAIISHELPQELGDFGVLVYGGMSKGKALFYNFISQLTAVIGGVVGFVIAGAWNFTVLLPFAAGGFIYIAASDLVPELHKEKNIKKSILSFIFFLVGIMFMLGIKIIFS